MYVHADTKGAIPLVIKNKPESPDAPIPPGTLAQAGTFSVATSNAWDSKALMGAWWVTADQVSKTTTTGEFLETGGVVIRGEKNHLAPGQLILGFAVLFQISPSSVANHTRHRLDDGTAVANAEISNQNEEGKSEDLEGAGNKQDDAHHTPELHTPQETGGSTSKLPAEESEQNEVEATSSLVEDNLEHENDSDNEENEVGIEEQEESGSPGGSNTLDDKQGGLSTKSQDLNALNTASSQKDENDRTPSTSRTPTPSVQSTSASKNQAQVRGKRAKAKKLASKYRDQDEEDRELALHLLGSAPKDTTPKKTKEDREAEIQAHKERRRAQHDKAAQAERRKQENLQRLLQRQKAGLGEEGIEEAPDDLSSLPTLVGTPVAKDEVLSAIPVCAPWSALGQYKYRAKLQPGTLGKGKAVREVLGKWIIDASTVLKAKKTSRPSAVEEGSQDGQDVGEPKSKENEQLSLTAVELELLRGWRENEIMNSLPIGKVKIVSVAGAGGTVTNAGDKKDSSKGKKAGGGGKGGKPVAKGGKKK